MTDPIVSQNNNHAYPQDMDFPLELRQLAQWVNAKLVPVPGKKPSKVPVDPKTSNNAAVNDPATWADLETALAGQSSTVPLLGFVFTADDGLFGMDLDNHIIDGRPTAVARKAIELSGSYAELSYFEKGVHIIAQGTLPRPVAKKLAGIECYDRGRFFVMTGNHLPGTSLEVNDGSALIRMLPDLILVAEAAARVRNASPGEGNDTLFIQAKQLFKRVPDHVLVEEAMLEAATWNNRRPVSEAQKSIESARNHAGDNPQAQATFSLGDSDHADILEEEFSELYRYAKHLGCWLRFDGRRWAALDDAEVINAAGAALRRIYIERLATAKVGTEQATLFAKIRESGKVHNVSNALTFLRGRPGFMVKAERWDSHPWLLNFQNGTLNLKTFELQSHDPHDLITRIVECNYNPEATCPTWDDTLKMALKTDRLISYMSRVLGYCLTGDTSAQALFICHGEMGNNGKTTLLEGFARALGPDYAGYADPRLLTTDQRDLVKLSSLAQLKGLRYVHMSELSENQQLDVALVKQMTGGDTVEAKFYHQNPFTFRPECKILVRTNEQPEVNSLADPVWRRLKNLPFTQVIPEGKRRKQSEIWEDFDREREGILAWAVRGLMTYQEHGLDDPEEVTASTQKYRDSSDVIARFVDDVRDPDGTGDSLLKDVYNRLVGWWHAEGKGPIPSNKALATRLRKLGYEVGPGTGRGAPTVVSGFCLHQIPTGGDEMTTDYGKRARGDQDH